MYSSNNAFQLPTSCVYNLHKKSFVISCLVFSLIVFFVMFNFIYYSCFTIVSIVFSV